MIDCLYQGVQQKIKYFTEPPAGILFAQKSPDL